MSLPILKKPFILKLITLLVVFSVATNFAFKNAILSRSFFAEENAESELNIVSRNYFAPNLDDHVFTTDCHCKNDTRVVLRLENNGYSVNYLEKNKLKSTYTLTSKEVNEAEFTCSHYNSFKRGKNQKIIGYALYGTGFEEDFLLFCLSYFRLSSFSFLIFRTFILL